MKRHFLAVFITLLLNTLSRAQTEWVKANYNKTVHDIPMRDGTKLHTIVYSPKDASASQSYPFLMQRTCYSIAPYGTEQFAAQLGPNQFLMRDKYIFVYQDVRGRYMSEGTWTNMTPHIPNKTAPTQVDEASDTYDTIEWLLKNIPHHNGRVGQWGISYPGFYTVAGALSQHPALKASSPQAPVSDFFFDDFHHNGAFTLGYFLTFPVFGIQHGKPTTNHWWLSQMINAKTKDGYQFNLDLGSLKNFDKYYKDNFFWQEHKDHPNYDEFWKKRSIVPHLQNVKHAVMTVGGWFDAEDIYGPLTVYKTLEKNNPNAYNTLVMGPFGHGRWSQETGHTLHSNVYFGDSIATFYQRNIERQFFQHFLKGAADGKTGLPEAYLFDTGKKAWQTFDKWPASAAERKTLYFEAGGKLSFDAPQQTSAKTDYISDPMKPVPYIEDNTETMGFTPFSYMSEDQRFAARRPDVLVFQTEPLTEDLTLGGEITAKLHISTTGSDADFFVKLIDVYPGDEPNHAYMPHKNVILSNYHQMVRSEIMRARFRNSFEKPEPLTPNKVTEVKFRLQDVLHTFKKGHRIQVQVQSTAFPLFDRNPQKYIPNIFLANDKDFIKATHSVYHQKKQASALEVQILK
ncbi:MAG: CocE/NonD family hydrolase [Spirosomaceae bacterium]|nr:CocE/NonD family hydrolase [Spirosomataceae bacterium]